MALDRFWMKLKKDRNQLFINMGVGFIILLIVICLEQYWWGWEEDKANAGLDILVRLENRLCTNGSMTQDLAKSPVFFIEITHQNRRTWKFPELTPRDTLARMVEDAWKRGAAVIVLDVLMEKPERGDSKLEEVLQRMLRESAVTHVIFPVTINSEGRLIKNHFDQLIDSPTKDQRRIFHRGVSLVEASGSDFLDRYWTLYQPYIAAESTKIVWNVAFLAAAIREQKVRELSHIANEIGVTSDGKKGAHAEYGIVLGGRYVEIPLLDRSQPNASDIPVTKTEFIRNESAADIYTRRIRFRLPVESPLIKLTADKFDGDENLLPSFRGKWS